jgi:hypothetical protein
MDRSSAFRRGDPAVVREYASCQGEVLVFLDLEAVHIGSVSERRHGYDLVVIPVFLFLVPPQRSRIRRLVTAVVTGARRRVEAQKVRCPSSAIVRDRVSEVL